MHSFYILDESVTVLPLLPFIDIHLAFIYHEIQ